jgi:SAM-dependent methyltransferase
MLKKIIRQTAHTVTNIRRYQYKNVAAFAVGKKNKKILELGSGKLLRRKYYYSTKHLFDPSNDFLQTDVVKEFGHPIVDATKMKYSNEFDVVLCLNVLEHVFDYQKAIANIYKALKKNGVAIIAVPAFYPLHDEPGDYWRFTEHSLRKLLADFKKLDLRHNGKREFPFSYYIEAKK